MQSSSSQIAQNKNTEVLLVDADAQHRTMVATALDDPSFTLTCRNRLTDALRAIHTHEPDVILIALDLPDSEPEHTLAVLRSISNLPVIVLCNRRCSSAAHALNSGAQDCVNPAQITPYGLVRSITHALERHAITSRLRRCESLETAGQVAGAIAHDLNNLMMVMSSCGELALGKLPDGHPAARYLGMSCEAATRAASLIEELLVCTRKRPVHIKTVDLNGFLTRLAPMLRHLVRSTVSLDLILADKPVPVTVDSADLEQAVVNLVVNARDAMPDGGQLTLSSAMRDKHAVLAVTDTGHGMDESTRSRAVEAFFTTKEAGKGTGVGLAMVDRFVTQSGGSVDITSAVGTGTTITLAFPLSSTSAADMGAFNSPSGCSNAD